MSCAFLIEIYIVYLKVIQQKFKTLFVEKHLYIFLSLVSQLIACLPIQLQAGSNRAIPVSDKVLIQGADNRQPAQITTDSFPASDCKYILDETCRNYFFLSGIEQLKTDLELTSRYNKILSVEQYFGKGITIQVEPSTNRVVAVEIDWFNKTWKPDKGLKWRTRMSGVEKKYGKGGYGRLISRETLTYPDFILHFDDEGLRTVIIQQPLTAAETAARKKRELVDDAQTLADDREYNRKLYSPEGIKEQFDKLHKTMEDYVQTINEKIKAMTVTDYTLRLKQEKEISNLKLTVMALIRDFMTRFKGKLPQAMIDHLNSDLSKLAADNKLAD